MEVHKVISLYNERYQSETDLQKILWENNWCWRKVTLPLKLEFQELSNTYQHLLVVAVLEHAFDIFIKLLAIYLISLRYFPSSHSKITKRKTFEH